ncbi:hypothetical protein N0V86_003592 [Didymella sp. IMI 355093]|nr:hypothetical protein N0V86_003592 [Didymella sp. IMI 355093]
MKPIELLRNRGGVASEASNMSILRTHLQEEGLLTAPNCTWSEEVVRSVSAKLQDELLRLEIQALQACMDDVGWTFPAEEDAKESLEYWLLHRLVQPGEPSGTAVRKALVCEGHPHFEDEVNDVMNVAA